MAANPSNFDLELACKLGARELFEEAVEDGADLDSDGGSPLFLAIMGGHRELVERLVELGVDTSLFLTKARRKKAKSPSQIVDALMEGAPPPPGPDEPPPETPGDEE